MELRVTVASAQLREINYTDKAGHPAQLRVQNAYLHVYDDAGKEAPFPEKFEIVLGRQQADAYAVGEYRLHPSAVNVDRNGRLACRPVLTPVAKR